MGITRLSATIAGAAAATMVVAATTALAGDHKHAELGEKAPAFTLTDSTGASRSLADSKGKIVVLEWINPRCPYVQNCYNRETMQGAYEAVKKLDKDAVWFAINTTHDTGADQNNLWVKQYKLEYPILLDTDGTVGNLYEAKRTPHMFVIDKEGTLRYHGAIDNNGGRPEKPADEVTTYVVEAVKQIVAGETVAPDYVKPYGCSVKYKKP